MKTLYLFIPSLFFLALITALHFSGAVEFRIQWGLGEFLCGIFSCALSIDTFKAISPRYLRDE